MVISRYKHSTKDLIIKINPMWIYIKNQVSLSFSGPTFYLLFTLNCCFHIRCFLKIHESVNFVFCGKTLFIQIIFVFIYTTNQIIGNPGI